MVEVRQDDNAPLSFPQGGDERYMDETTWTERVRSILLAQPLNPLAQLGFKPWQKESNGKAT